MKNFNNGRDINVNGNFIINDNSSVKMYKPLNQCTKQELVDEYQHRKNLLEEAAKDKKIKSFEKSVTLSIFMLIFAAIQFFYFDHKELAQFIIAIGSFIAPIMLYFKSIEYQTEFEKRQILIINEINYLYKEKRE